MAAAHAEHVLPIQAFHSGRQVSRMIFWSKEWAPNHSVQGATKGAGNVAMRYTRATCRQLVGDHRWHVEATVQTAMISFSSQVQVNGGTSIGLDQEQCN